MGKKNNITLNKVEIKRDSGDDLKKFVKYKNIAKKEEFPKDLVKDRGDSLTKTVKGKFNLQASKENEKLDNNKSIFIGLIQDRVLSKNIKRNETVSNILDKSEQKKSNKIPADLTTDRCETRGKITDIKWVKNKHIVKSMDSVSKNNKQKDLLGKSADVDMIDTAVSKTPIDKFSKNKKYYVTSKILDVSNDLKKNIVDNEKSNRLHVEEKKRIREKYTFKLKPINNQKLDVDSNLRNQVEIKNDISKEVNSVPENKENTDKLAVNDKISNSTVKLPTQTVIRTIVEKNSLTKIYKEVTFAKQKPKVVTPLQIKMPVLMKNMKPNNTIDVSKTKLIQIDKKIDNKNNIDTHISDLTTNIKSPFKLTKNKDNLIRNIKKPKQSKVNMLENKKIVMKLDRNSKISHDLTNKSNISKLFRNNMGVHDKFAKKSQSSHSQSRTSSMKTKSSKKETKRRFKCKLSPVLLRKETLSPPTEVAKWAPNSITGHTKPYYEAWVNTTLTAISKNKDMKLDYDNKELIKTLKEMMERRCCSPELVHENFLDERYTGKIKVNHKKRI